MSACGLDKEFEKKTGDSKDEHLKAKGFGL